jgi:hypothetical protein
MIMKLKNQEVRAQWGCRISEKKKMKEVTGSEREMESKEPSGYVLFTSDDQTKRMR